MSVLCADRIDWPVLMRPSRRVMYAPLLHVGAGVDVVARHARGRLVYLATPYSREAVTVAGAWNFGRSVEVVVRAARAARGYALAGVSAVSPVVMAGEMCHADHACGGAAVLDPLDAVFWERWCRPLLHSSAALAVPALPGWAQSRGIWREVLWALERNVPVFVEAGGVGDG